MTAKVQIKNDTINSFGGIFFAIDQFRASRLAKLVNNTLGSKGLNARFKFSDTLENMASIFLSGGEVLEDVNFFRTFYIRAMGCQTLEKRIAEIKEEEWQTTEINYQECGLASLPFTAFFAERGASERTFDMQNNDFGWKHLPFSFMKENTVFMILTALIRNFYVWLVGKIAANKAFGLEATSRVKKFVFRFVQVPFRWVFRSRQWHLQLYTSRPYDRLRL